MTKVQLTILCVWDLLYDKKISKGVLGKVTELLPLKHNLPQEVAKGSYTCMFSLSDSEERSRGTEEDCKSVNADDGRWDHKEDSGLRGSPTV